MKSSSPIVLSITEPDGTIHIECHNVNDESWLPFDKMFVLFDDFHWYNESIGKYNQ